MMNATDVKTVGQFLEKYYRRDRYRGRGEEYAAGLLKSHQAHFEKYGYDLISRHDSNQGVGVWFGTPTWRRENGR